MCQINVRNLSPELIKDAMKYAKEGTIDKHTGELAKLAAKDGLNNDEKLFLEGLKTDKNVNILKNSNFETKTLEFDISAKGTKINTPNQQISKPEKNFSFNASPVIDTMIPQAERIRRSQLQNFVPIPEGPPIKEDPITKVIEDRNELNFKSNGKNVSFKFSQVESLFNDAFGKLDSGSKSQLKTLLDSNTFEKEKALNLKALLIKGTLMEKDKDGKTVLKNIFELYNGEALVGETPQQYKKNKDVAKEIAKDAVDVLLSSAYLTQGEHFTCGAASVENYLRLNNPGELVRIVKDLAMKGEVTLKDGSKMNAPTGSLNFKAGDSFSKKNTEGLYKDHNTEDRSRFNIIFQSAVMDEIALVGGDRNPLNNVKNIANTINELNPINLFNPFHKTDFSAKDDATYNVRNDADGGWKSGDGASYWIAIKNVINSINDGKSEIKTHGISEIDFATNSSTMLDSPRLASKLFQFLQENPGKQAIIMYHKGDSAQNGAHYVMVNQLVKKDDGKYYAEIFNTMANTGKDGYNNHRNDKDRLTYSQVIYKPLEELARSLNAVVLMK